jgi:nitrate/nitrite-specific signal transduction histidine kinase
LLGVRERVGLLNGAVLIEPAPGAGTTVTASFPPQRRPIRVTQATQAVGGMSTP